MYPLKFELLCISMAAFVACGSEKNCFPASSALEMVSSGIPWFFTALEINNHIARDTAGC